MIEGSPADTVLHTIAIALNLATIVIVAVALRRMARARRIAALVHAGRLEAYRLLERSLIDEQFRMLDEQKKSDGR